MIEVVCNDRLGKKVRVKCKYPPAAERQWFLGHLSLCCRGTFLGEGADGVLVECIQPWNALFHVLPPPSIFLNSSAPSTDDTIGDLKKLIAAQTGTRWNKIVLKKW